MRRGKHRKFGRVKNQRKALHKALTTALIEYGRIKTTLAKAKDLSQIMGGLITKAKNKSIASRRLVGQNLGEKALKKLFDEIGPKFGDRNGGYTRIAKLGRRKSDGAEMALIEFIK